MQQKLIFLILSFFLVRTPHKAWSKEAPPTKTSSSKSKATPSSLLKTPTIDATKKMKSRAPSQLNEELHCYQFNIGLDLVTRLELGLPRKLEEKSTWVALGAWDRTGRAWWNYFFCSQGTQNHFHCTGDDDGGRFNFSIQEESVHLSVEFISFGDPDEPGPHIPSSKRLEGKQSTCPQIP